MTTKNSPLTKIITQAVETIQAKVNFESLHLKPEQKTAQLKIIEQDSSSPEIYPLLGDRYTIGRSSRCDIKIRNPVVSQTHLSISRNKRNLRSFIVKDEKSTNGVYRGQRRLKTFSIYHGESFTLGPPELAGGVKVEYYNPPPWWLYLVRYSLYSASGVIGLIFFWIGIAWLKVPVYPLPKESSRPVVVYARDGVTPLNPIAQNTHRELRNLADFSPYLPQAVIASEDSRYYWHFGVDPYGIARAVLINFRSSELKQGASTVTQQLARSLFPEVGRQNTAGRKIREMLVALKLETVYSKNQILKTYLNRVYLGIGIYGFEDAAQFYFEKSAAELNLSETATLVAVLPAPNLYNPVKDYETSVQLRNRVIDRMQKLGMVSEEEADRARRSRIEVSENARRTISSTVAPYFYGHVLGELQSLLGREVAKEGNFIIETSLDPTMQKKAELALKDSVTSSGSRFGYSQGAIVTLNSETGEIIALVGGVDYRQSQFNRATQAKRQPGSTFKVFAYAAAINRGINPDKEYSCAPISWQGQRYRGCERSRGNIDMYRGLAQSENAVAFRVAKDAGLSSVIDTAQNLGIKSSLKASPGLVIGESEVTVLEITGAYAALANKGIWSRPHAINRILDGSDCTDPSNRDTCREIYSFGSDRENRRRVISSRVTNKMTKMMRKVIKEGTGKAARIGKGEAGKTGTTDKNVDLWFIGYIPNQEIVTGIWLGNDDNSPTRGSSGQAAALWGSYMRDIISK